MQDETTKTEGTDAASTRRTLLTRAAWSGLAAVPVLSFLSNARGANPPPTMNPRQALDASAKEAFDDIRKHENEHVAFLKTALGGQARVKPTFKGLATTSFSQFVLLARTFEITGVGAYLGALPAIASAEYRNAAASIALVEARHAGFLNVFSGTDITLQASTKTYASFDTPLTLAQVQAAVSPFIQSLNGGPPASFTAGDDISILNFALLLEYLEAEFYQGNVSKYI